MDIRSIGVYYSNPYRQIYRINNNNNSRVSFQNALEIEKRLLCTNNGVSAKELLTAKLNEMGLNSEQQREIQDFFSACLSVINKIQKRNCVLEAKNKELKNTNFRLRNKAKKS